MSHVRRSVSDGNRETHRVAVVIAVSHVARVIAVSHVARVIAVRHSYAVGCMIASP